MARRLGLLLVVLGLALPLSAARAADEPSGHDAHGAGPDAHGSGHGDHVPSFDQINWYHGMVGEKEGVEPSVLWRPEGTPPPLGALLLNSAILYFLLYRMLRKPVAEGLKRRKATLLQGMEEAAKMQREAEQQLAEYEGRLARLEEEVARLLKETRENAAAERVRVLAEAREHRTRMERDAELLVAQELVAVRDELLRETARTAIRSAEETLIGKLTAADQQRFAEDYLSDVAKAAPALRGRL